MFFIHKYKETKSIRSPRKNPCNLCSPGESEPQEDDAQSEVSDNIPADRKPKKSSLLDKISAQTIKMILELLCDESVSDGLNMFMMFIMNLFI